MTRKEKYKKFLKSEYWYNVRTLVFQRDGHKCSRCPETKTLQVHHLRYDHHGEEHLHLEDLIILCRNCHKKEHNKKIKKKPKPPFFFVPIDTTYEKIEKILKDKNIDRNSVRIRRRNNNKIVKQKRISVLKTNTPDNPYF